MPFPQLVCKCGQSRRFIRVYTIRVDLPAYGEEVSKSETPSMVQCANSACGLLYSFDGAGWLTDSTSADLRRARL
jgi:heme oxygenase